jgi:hypothetical protein
MSHLQTEWETTRILAYILSQIVESKIGLHTARRNVELELTIQQKVEITVVAIIYHNILPYGPRLIDLNHHKRVLVDIG